MSRIREAYDKAGVADTVALSTSNSYGSVFVGTPRFTAASLLTGVYGFGVDLSNAATGRTCSYDAPDIAAAATFGTGVTYTITATSGNPLLTTSTAHGLVAGNTMQFTALAGATGISVAVTYYVATAPSTTTLTISATYPSGTILTPGGTIAGTLTAVGITTQIYSALLIATFASPNTWTTTGNATLPFFKIQDSGSTGNVVQVGMFPSGATTPNKITITANATNVSTGTEPVIPFNTPIAFLLQVDSVKLTARLRVFSDWKSFTPDLLDATYNISAAIAPTNTSNSWRRTLVGPNGTVLTNTWSMTVQHLESESGWSSSPNIGGPPSPPIGATAGGYITRTYPTADVTTTGLTSSSNPSPLSSLLNNPTLATTTFISSGLAPTGAGATGERLEFTSSTVNSGAGRGMITWFWASLVTGSVTGSMVATVRNAGSVIATRTFTVTATAAKYQVAFTESEQALLPTGALTLSIRLDFTAS